MIDMAHRAEVFRSKVLQKLYPTAPELEKEPSPQHTVEALAKKSHVKRTAFQGKTKTGDAGKMSSETHPGRRRLYTVLPPPADYKTNPEISVTLCQQESINSSEEPAEDSDHNSNEDREEDEEVKPITKKRRRKRKPSLPPDSSREEAVTTPESSTGKRPTAVDEGEERLSRNKKRKLKKKRHKERLRSMGLMPQATALEFTYRKDGEDEEEEEEEEEDVERRNAEVADFLRTTMEIYMSDPSSCSDKHLLQPETVDDLLHRITSGGECTSILKQLHSLKVLVQQKETGKMEKALEELHSTTSMSAEKTTAVVALFKYWITDIIPMQGYKKTGLSPAHP